MRQYARILTELQNKFYGDMVLCYTKCFDINIDERSTHLEIRERHEINSDPFVVPMIISKGYFGFRVTYRNYAIRVASRLIRTVRCFCGTKYAVKGCSSKVVHSVSATASDQVS